jgi:hypothetical protein
LLVVTWNVYEYEMAVRHKLAVGQKKSREHSDDFCLVVLLRAAGKIMRPPMARTNPTNTSNARVKTRTGFGFIILI